MFLRSREIVIELLSSDILSKQGLSIQRPRHALVSDVRSDLIAVASPHLYISAEHHGAVTLQFIPPTSAAPLIFSENETLKDVREALKRCSGRDVIKQTLVSDPAAVQRNLLLVELRSPRFSSAA
jgi:hypothetical protein